MASLSLRTGALGERLAAHLLRRSTFAVTSARIADFATKTATEAVDELFDIPPLTHPEGPINWVNGSTAWLTTGPYSSNPGSSSAQRMAVWMWLSNEMLHDPSIRHRMTLFWHSIFTTGSDDDWRIFDLVRLFQLFATGNIKTLAYKATLDNKMLRYLNNNVNSKTSPNENYAREFLELFTILKGQQIETGNYTNYTEHDIQQAARVLSGFKDTGFSNKDPQTGLATGYASYSSHDVGNKKFSAAFNYHTILGAVSAADMYRELQNLVDMIFNQPETARAYARRMYRFFVSDRIDAEIEADIIAPLAAQLLADGYDIAPALKTLLRSKHFYDEDDSSNQDEIIGGKIKSPLELYLTSINLFNANQLGVLNSNPAHYNNTANHLLTYQFQPMGFSFYPLSVEGYPGFYKGPNYSKSWFDQSTIAMRYRLAASLLQGKTVKDNKAVPFQISLVAYFSDTFEHQDYAPELVAQLLRRALPEMPDVARVNYFKQKLLGGLSEINWAFEWLDFLETGDDASVKIALENLFSAVCGSAEFQTF